MDIKNLITFREVARTLSFSRAAQSLNYAQSTVTTQIQVLEQELGTPLFNRVGKRITLTDAGERLLVYAEKMANLEIEARMALSNVVEESMGKLTIDAEDGILYYLMPRLLRAYRSRYPQVDLNINARHVDDMVDVVEVARTGMVDVGIAYTLSPQADMTWEQVAVVPTILVAAPDHALAQKNRVTPGDVDGEVIFYTIPDCPYRQLFEGSLERFETHPHNNMQLRHYQSIKKAVVLGRGVSLFAPFIVADEIAKGDLVKLELDWLDNDLRVPAWLVWNPDKWLSPAAEAFRQLVHEMLFEEVYREERTV